MNDIDIPALFWWLAGGVGYFILGIGALAILSLFIAPPDVHDPLIPEAEPERREADDPAQETSSRESKA